MVREIVMEEEAERGKAKRSGIRGEKSKKRTQGEEAQAAPGS